MKRFLGVVAAFFYGLISIHAQQNSLDAALKEAVQSVLTGVPSGATVAVAYFDIQTRAVKNDAAVVIADYAQAELGTYLVNSRRVKVLERQKINMDRVQSSLDFDMSGLVSDESAQLIGHFLGVQYLVFGSLKSAGAGFQLYVDTVRVESSEKVASYSKPLDRNALARFVNGNWDTGQSGNRPPGQTGQSITRSNTGVYVGIVQFGPEAEDITGGAPILLDAAGFAKVNEALDKRYQRTTKSGTALYYAVHRALAAASANAGQYPSNLENVYLVTFTDGLDMGSTSFSLSPIENRDFSGGSEEDYRDFLINQIRNRPIAGRSIIAYSAGVRGSDVTDGKGFSESLSGLASAPSNFYELTNFAQLNGRFEEIAKQLTITRSNTTFTLRTSSLSVGTKVRMTFDNAGPDGSKRYVEGTVSAENRNYVLTDIKYEGTSSIAGSRVFGVMDGTEVNYSFGDFTGYGAGAKQWIRRGNGAWQVNSEYAAGNTVTTETEYKSAVVYLALDASLSLKAEEVTAVRNAAKQFVKTLYERSRGVSGSAPGVVQPGPPKPAPVPEVVQPTPPKPASGVIPPNFVLIRGGTFTMGSPASEKDRYDREGPQHQVTVSSFYLGKYEVTQKEWQEVMGSNPSYFKGDTLPVDVSWYDAIEYCNKRSQREGLTPAYTRSGDNVTWNRNANGYRLPTEAEWEYACRAGTTTPYYTGSSVDNAGWYGSNSGGTTHPVGQKQANAWGLYDMHGNVWEWCWDWYGSYSSGSQTDPVGASSGTDRVLRGGCWVISAGGARSA